MDFEAFTGGVVVHALVAASSFKELQVFLLIGLLVFV